MYCDAFQGQEVSSGMSVAAVVPENSRLGLIGRKTGHRSLANLPCVIVGNRRLVVSRTECM